MAENMKESTDYMHKNDDRILELKKQIENKRATIEKGKVRFVPETNCILNIDGTTINLNVCTDDALQLLLVRLHSYSLAAIDLGLQDFQISGYSITAWINDIKNKLQASSLKKEEKNLNEMENKLLHLLSEDKKTELEINEIEALLK